jgi:hypothetical protein
MIQKKIEFPEKPQPAAMVVIEKRQLHDPMLWRVQGLHLW